MAGGLLELGVRTTAIGIQRRAADTCWNSLQSSAPARGTAQHATSIIEVSRSVSGLDQLNPTLGRMGGGVFLDGQSARELLDFFL